MKLYRTLHVYTCRYIKDIIVGLGSNVTPTAIHRVSRCLGQLQSTLEQFSQQTGYHQPSGLHSVPKVSKDVQVVVQELLRVDVFAQRSGRMHGCFRGRRPLLVDVNYDRMTKWLRRCTWHVLMTQ